MIIVKLMGGLGNQMFQYAAARRLANHHNTELKLDLSFLEGSQGGGTYRTYQLNHFGISALPATSREVAELSGKGGTLLQTVATRLRQLCGRAERSPHVFKEQHFHFVSELLTAPDNVYLDGYWQSEKYFQDIAGILKHEFTVSHPLEGRNREMADLAMGTNSVSLHVRRGDFVADATINKVHGVCSTDYYRRGVEELARQTGKLHLFVFSDEPAWAAENLDFSFPTTIVDHNSADQGYEDLRLMSLCRHHIIANSSFSWWGAWLNQRAEKIVIAPMKWFNASDMDARDVVPDGWQRI